MDPAPRHGEGKTRSYAEVLAGPKGSFETQACHRHNSTGSDASSVPAQRRGQHSLNASKFPAPSDGARREEPPRSSKGDKFWDSEYGLPMSTKSFQTIDSAVWGAINILLSALKGVSEDWSGFKEVGMTGKNLAPLQAIARGAEKILAYNLFQNRGSRDRKQMKVGLRYKELPTSLLVLKRDNR